MMVATVNLVSIDFFHLIEQINVFEMLFDRRFNK